MRHVFGEYCPEDRARAAIYCLLPIVFLAILSPHRVSAQQVRFPANNFAPNAGASANPWNAGLAPPSTGQTFGPAASVNAPWPGIPAPTTLGAQGLVNPYGTTTTPMTAGGGLANPYNAYPNTTGTAVIRPNSSPFLPPTSMNSTPVGSSWNFGNLFGTSPTAYQPYPQGTTVLPGAASYPAGTSYPGVTGYSNLPNTYPNSIYPNQTPPALFPGTLSGAYPPNNYGNPYGNPYNPNAGSVWNPTWNGPLLNGQPYGNSSWGNTFGAPMRFFVAPRFRHTWIAAEKDPEALGINDTDGSLLFQVPGFLGSTQPLYVVPSFSLHMWDGPKTTTADLPGSAYSAFLDFGWETDPQRTFGTELGFRVGAFTDFKTFNAQSIRYLGKVLGKVRLTPSSTFKIGAYWLDRNRIKLLPAVGILWVPNPDTRFDIFFPEPKLSHYVTTLGDKDVWWYVTGYYGGGAWTIERADGSSDEIDINDIRVALGVEWGKNNLLRQGQRIAFAEAGYVFRRELIYRIRPQDNLDLQESFMVRAGFIY